MDDDTEQKADNWLLILSHQIPKLYQGFDDFQIDSVFDIPGVMMRGCLGSVKDFLSGHKCINENHARKYVKMDSKKFYGIDMGKRVSSCADCESIYSRAYQEFRNKEEKERGDLKWA